MHSYSTLFTIMKTTMTNFGGYKIFRPRLTKCCRRCVPGGFHAPNCVSYTLSKLLKRLYIYTRFSKVLIKICYASVQLRFYCDPCTGPPFKERPLKTVKSVKFIFALLKILLKLRCTQKMLYICLSVAANVQSGFVCVDFTI